MRRVASLALCVGVQLASLPTGAQAAEIKLISAGAVRAVVSELADSFAKESGHHVHATFGTVGVVRQKLASDPADVIMASDTALEDLLRQNAVVAGTRADIARA